MVHNIENDNPKTFTNIKVFAGDKSKPAADASYKNLVWENLHANQSLNIGTKIQKNKQIGTVDSLGPFFRVSLDLLVHRIHKYPQNVLVLFTKKFFILDISIVRSKLTFAYSINNKYQGFNFDQSIQRNHWYNIVIETKPVNGKVIKSQIVSSNI